MSKNLSYSENFKQLAKGDTIVLECIDEIPDKAFPVQKGTIQKWEVSHVDVVKENVVGFNMTRKIKGLPKQTIKVYNIFIKDDVIVSPKTIFMPYNCQYKISIQKKGEKVSPLRKLFST